MESIEKISAQAQALRQSSKRLLALTALTFAASVIAVDARGQTFSEWFRQKSTQKKYLVQQIAALQLYADYYRAGNRIASSGLGSISGNLMKENGLHAAYFKGLTNVNPNVRNSSQIQDILQWQQDILIIMAKPARVSGLSAWESQYLNSVKTALYADCNTQMKELERVLADNRFKMSDEERFRRIGLIHAAMQSNHAFACSYSRQLTVYLHQRNRERLDVISENKIFGLQ